jgi:hypothetical protein
MFRMKKTFLTVVAVTVLSRPGLADIENTVAHWSFDASTLTTIGAEINGVADATGAHNASPGSGLGQAALSSNPIPAANSVPGHFGEALTLTGFNNAAGGGGQFLMFPELTEIMAVSGAPSYTVSMWVNTNATTFNVFTDLSSWGNASATPGRFSYAFGPSGSSQMRAQTRFDAGTNGTDIFARSVTTPAPLNDSAWHMLSWTFDPGAKLLKSYFDGALIDTFPSTAVNTQMVTSSSAFGTLGFKGDSGNFFTGSFTFDEMYVFRGVASDAQIQNLYNLNVIPEPVSAALTAFAGGIMAAFRRSRRTTSRGKHNNVAISGRRKTRVKTN